ncbi:MAG: glycosyltransferase family 4 protein [Bacteroidia bacterium]
MAGPELRIMHIIPNLGKGGAERLTLDICRELSLREGLRVMLLVLDEKNEYKFLSEGLQIQYCTSYVKSSLSGKSQVDLEHYKGIVAAFKPDIIHSHLFAADFFSRELLFQNVKYFTHCHDNMVQFTRPSLKSFFSKQAMTRLFERHRIFRQYKKCDNKFIAISEDVKLFLESNLGAALRKNIIKLPNAIDVSRFNKVDRKAPGSGEKMRLINIGSFVEKKNQSFLIDVSGKLKALGISFELHFIGDGPLRERVEMKAVETGLASYVKFHGTQDYVEEFLGDSDIYVHSALYEPFGLVLVEAFASGLPVIALNAGGNSELIREGQNGFLLRGPDPELFAAAICRLFRDKELYSSLSESAKSTASQYDIKLYVDELLKIYFS